MRHPKALDKLKRLLSAPSFTSKEARYYGVSSSTLAYYVNQKRLNRIGHGVYRSADTGPIVDDFRWEDLVEVVQGIKGGIVCLTSALSLYDLTEEMASQFWIAIRNDTVHRATANTKVVRMRNVTLGRTQIKIGQISILIFDRERTIIDAFRYLSKETALKALKMALTKKGTERIDLEKLRKYAKILRVKIEPYLMAMTV